MTSKQEVNLKKFVNSDREIAESKAKMLQENDLGQIYMRMLAHDDIKNGDTAIIMKLMEAIEKEKLD